VNALRARLAVDEAQVIPYTPEELALFKQPAPQLASRNAEKKSVQGNCPAARPNWWPKAQVIFPPGSSTRPGMIIKNLQRDENNGLVLANLGND